ncbi:hypothetical protein ACFWBC_36955 [Streptomyces sp. NPDC059985]|uniref:hypothetical protein n=1 Tax=Streptomyces sp. NPDC059985 TaxID=3347025 RepID=UPI0036845952
MLLHTSKTTDRPALRVPPIARTIRDRELVTGAVVGIARITDCHQDPEGAALCSQWALPGVWHLVLADVQELPQRTISPTGPTSACTPTTPTRDTACGRLAESVPGQAAGPQTCSGLPR